MMLTHFGKYIRHLLLTIINIVPLSIKLKFFIIHKLSLWNSSESKSGTGSELQRGINFISNTKEIIKKYDIGSILDIPCGDLNLMNVILTDTPIKYTGVDIVEPMIQKHKKTFEQGGNNTFICADACTDTLPDADLVIVRDFLFHLSNNDLHNFLINLNSISFKYLQVTSHELKVNLKYNNDINTSGFRYLDLFSTPFNFPKPVLKFLDYEDEKTSNIMCLFDEKTLKQYIKSQIMK